MKILILGGDGYLGWPTAMHFSRQGEEVVVVDNYLRRDLCSETNSAWLFPLKSLQERSAVFQSKTGTKIEVEIGDLVDHEFMNSLIKRYQPDVIVHYAEQPSAPFSMKDQASASLTLNNNLMVTHNMLQAVLQFCPECHIIKLGTMGEYGTPNIDIEEGWINISHNGRSDTFLYPRAASSLYHTTKVLDTDLIWFYVRAYGLTVTDLMQGPVYGFLTPESRLDEQLLPIFNYDDIFGTVLNRFMVQAVAGIPLTVYGEGGQTRGYLNLNDTLQCISLAMKNKPKTGELRILNQFTETFTVNELAHMVMKSGEEMGIRVKIKNIQNPRKELENHYYNPLHSGFEQLGLTPMLLTTEVLIEHIILIQKYKNKINKEQIIPRVNWSNK